MRTSHLQKMVHYHRLCYSLAKMTFFIFLLLIQMSCGSTATSVHEMTTATTGVAATVFPTNGSAEFSTSGTVTASFRENVVSASITGSTFVVEGPEGGISGAVSYDTTARTATFTPAAP